jgi:hypothetical protein
MKYKYFVFFMIVFSFVAEAKWACFSKYDKMDDVRINGCSTDDKSGYRTFRGTPTLYVRTTNNELEIYLSANEYVGNIEEIEVKFDNLTKEIVSVGSSTDNVAMFISESDVVNFAKKLMKYKKLLVRFTPLNENPRTLEFNLIGLNSKSSSKLIGVINLLVDTENKKIEQDIKDEETAKLQAIKDEEATKLLAQKELEEKERLVYKEIEERERKEKEFYKIEEILKNNGSVTGEICEQYGGVWSWYGNINEWKCESQSVYWKKRNVVW